MGDYFYLMLTLPIWVFCFDNILCFAIIICLILLIILEVALFDFWLCGAASFMEKDELCKEPKEIECEGEGIISGSKGLKKDHGHGKNDKRKAKERG